MGYKPFLKNLILIEFFLLVFNFYLYKSLKSVLSLKSVNKQLDVPISALRLGYTGQSVCLPSLKRERTLVLSWEIESKVKSVSTILPTSLNAI